MRNIAEPDVLWCWYVASECPLVCVLIPPSPIPSAYPVPSPLHPRSRGGRPPPSYTAPVPIHDTLRVLLRLPLRPHGLRLPAHRRARLLQPDGAPADRRRAAALAPAEIRYVAGLFADGIVAAYLVGIVCFVYVLGPWTYTAESLQLTLEKEAADGEGWRSPFYWKPCTGTDRARSRVVSSALLGLFLGG
jgi:hypothetical protein